MWRLAIFLGLLVIFTGGCIRQTYTEVPALSGTVVDNLTGQPLTGVKINEYGRTAVNGGFALPAVARKIWTLPLMGAGIPVHRTLVFQKNGYRSTTCTCTNFTLFAENNRVVIPLVHIDAAARLSPNPPMLRVNDHTVNCQAFVGSLVLYEGQRYLISDIYAAKTEGAADKLFALQPLPAKGGSVIEDVSEFNLLLTAMGQE